MLGCSTWFVLYALIFSNVKVPSPPTITDGVTAAELQSIIFESLPRLDNNNIWLHDNIYGLYPKSDLERFLAYDSLNKERYETEKFDCDDFSVSLMGRERAWYKQTPYSRASPLGFAFGDIRKDDQDAAPFFHAINIFVDENRKLWLVEPQTDAITEPTPNSSFMFVMV